MQELHFITVGYALVLFASFALLWTFGRDDGTSSDNIATACVVLSFPAALGAALVRLAL